MNERECYLCTLHFVSASNYPFPKFYTRERWLYLESQKYFHKKARQIVKFPILHM